MNHVAMNPHLSEAGRHRYGLVGNHPHFRSPTISLHREPNGSAIDRANPNLFQCRDDSARHFVGLVCRVMEFEIRDGTSRRPDVPSRISNSITRQTRPTKWRAESSRHWKRLGLARSMAEPLGSLWRLIVGDRKCG